MKKFYITTAIDYVNGTIHLGHAFQKIAADILARFYRLKLGKTQVFFLTGTDEYGQRAEKAAKETRTPTKEYVDEIAKSDKKQQDSLNISYDRFIRTTDPDHTKVAQEIWKRVDKNGDIYLGDFKGLYCPGCEAYYTKKDLSHGKCQFHPTLEIQEFSEKNFFFRWSKYQEFLVDHIENHPEFVFPESKRQEVLSFARGGIQDIPISRTSFKWGVPVPNQPNHIMYVWFDALTNYLTGIGFLENPKLFEKFWPADIHILGKDNLRWHALLWPAMLKSAGLELPKTILVNGFLGLNGQKISKSLGNVIRPTDWVEKYGSDAVRYYLMRYTTVTEDSDTSEEKLKTAYNADLANGLGNLVARVAKLCEQNNLSIEPIPYTIGDDIGKVLLEYKFNEALTLIWEKIAEVDKKIDEEKPWELEGEKLKKILEDYVARIQQIAFNLQPFLPETSQKILKQFSGRIKSDKPLFPRLT
ncbi:methionine--tRNA ligase [Candidatus Daviesbacteria bacterium]|nr:methionine--tRNA ligase [Candidatus Daviesbacteria bacterium]